MNDNIKNVQISGIRKFYNEVQKVENAISLTLGQPDFELPKAIKEGLIKAIDENKTTYTSNAGIIELRDEISKYLGHQETAITEQYNLKTSINKEKQINDVIEDFMKEIVSK